MNKQEQVTSSEYKDRNCENTRRLRNWTAAWVISMGIAAFAPKYAWEFNTLLSVIAVIVSLFFGFGMLLANRRYLRGLDEMQQRIMFDAMGLALGVGLVVGLSYELLEDIKLITFQPEIPHLVFVMCFTYLIGIVAGHRKFQ
jgi:drug/metabolite transporter (DMT)-like permease